MNENKMLSLSTVARLLDVSVSTVRRMIKDKRIKAVRIGKQWKIAQEELKRILEEGA